MHNAPDWDHKIINFSPNPCKCVSSSSCTDKRVFHLFCRDACETSSLGQRRYCQLSVTVYSLNWLKYVPCGCRTFLVFLSSYTKATGLAPSSRRRFTSQSQRLFQVRFRMRGETSSRTSGKLPSYSTPKKDHDLDDWDSPQTYCYLPVLYCPVPYGKPHPGLLKQTENQLEILFHSKWEAWCSKARLWLVWMYQ